MLEALRRASQTWVAKALLIVLVGSFAVWGVSSSLVTGTASSVVTVGDVKVSPTDFRLAYERQVAMMSQRFGMRINAEQARAFGVENQVFAELVAGAALDQLSHDMNLGLSEGRLARLIADDPAFRGVNGQFDRTAFSAILRNAGLRETEQEQRNRTEKVDHDDRGFQRTVPRMPAGDGLTGMIPYPITNFQIVTVQSGGILPIISKKFLSPAKEIDVFRPICARTGFCRALQTCCALQFPRTFRYETYSGRMAAD